MLSPTGIFEDSLSLSCRWVQKAADINEKARSAAAAEEGAIAILIFSAFLHVERPSGSLHC